MSRLSAYFFRRRARLAAAFALGLLLAAVLLLTPAGAAARPLLQAAALALPTVVLLLPGNDHPTFRGHSFHRENVLGTSLDLHVNAADAETARACEAAVIAEITRLEGVLSARDPESEINRPDGSPKSADLADALAACAEMADRTGGLVDPHMGGVVALWKEAARTGTLPSPADIREALARRGATTPHLDALGKAYVIDRAARKAMSETGVAGLLLNVGGDLVALGAGNAGPELGWRVGIADPADHADNATPMVALHLCDQALATSAAYARPLVIGGETYSHLIDPRTGYPARGVASASAVAGTAVEANALSAALHFVPPAKAVEFAKRFAGASVHVVDAAGAVTSTLSALADEKKEAPAAAWAKDHKLDITLDIIKPTTGRKIRRPYVAVWIENAEGKPVRTLAEWGTNRKWTKDLYDWWKFASKDPALVKAVSKATRAPGSYTLTWDGTDDAGKPVPAGTYTVQVEVHREFGKHVRQTGKIACGSDKAAAEMAETVETGKTKLSFGPKAAKP